MNEPQVRGLFFEKMIRSLLTKSGYANVQEGMVRGRGEEHQIDAYGKFSFNIPFVFPIRLLSEAKWYKRNVRLPEIRNFVGVVKDISENYFVKPRTNNEELEHLLEKRYTDCGSIFSATSFSPKAQRYAYAHGIYLIPFSRNVMLKGLLDIVEKDIKNNIKRFDPKHYEVFEETGNKKTYDAISSEILDGNDDVQKRLNEVGSYVGILDGIYPIMILTSNKLNFNQLSSDEYGIIGEKQYMEADDTSMHFLFTDEQDKQLEFTFPIRIARELLSSYKKYPTTPFSYIDVPITIKSNGNTYRRIYNLKISSEDREIIMDNIKVYLSDYLWNVSNEG